MDHVPSIQTLPSEILTLVFQYCIDGPETFFRLSWVSSSFRLVTHHFHEVPNHPLRDVFRKIVVPPLRRNLVRTKRSIQSMPNLNQFVRSTEGFRLLCRRMHRVRGLLFFGVHYLSPALILGSLLVCILLFWGEFSRTAAMLPFAVLVGGVSSALVAEAVCIWIAVRFAEQRGLSLSGRFADLWQARGNLFVAVCFVGVFLVSWYLLLPVVVFDQHAALVDKSNSTMLRIILNWTVRILRHLFGYVCLAIVTWKICDTSAKFVDFLSRLWCPEPPLFRSLDYDQNRRPALRYSKFHRILRAGFSFVVTFWCFVCGVCAVFFLLEDIRVLFSRVVLACCFVPFCVVFLVGSEWVSFLEFSWWRDPEGPRYFGEAIPIDEVYGVLGQKKKKPTPKESISRRLVKFCRPLLATGAVVSVLTSVFLPLWPCEAKHSVFVVGLVVLLVGEVLALFDGSLRTTLGQLLGTDSSSASRRFMPVLFPIDCRPQRAEIFRTRPLLGWQMRD